MSTFMLRSPSGYFGGRRLSHKAFSLPPLDWGDLAKGPNGMGRAEPPYIPGARAEKLLNAKPKDGDSIISLGGVQSKEDPHDDTWLAGWSSFTMHS